ncbi:MAG: formyltransferase family protein [Erythrobacter sp.]|uniref:methionyl-tRNA formyltransferase n=1 Tax=Erythrobacter sp. TaxID=1042 RepID=UPI00263924A7|nr:formyltransferase family protein [Erythrobacter sp.]MDJ0978694.1 formyltransferase family protein [Erythrobacter sp.]
MRVALVGAVESSLCALRAMIEAGCPPCLVATLNEELSRRHSDFVALAPIAEQHGVPVVHVRNINEPDAIEAVRQAAPDYIFVVGWSQICGDEFMQLTPGRVIGYHPAPLPRMRGRAVLPWTILNDEKITGATLFWMDGGVDTGDILEQRFFHVAPRETARTLYDKHMEALSSMVRASLVSLASSAPPREIQDEACATFAARRRPEDGQINWNSSARDIDRLIRAVSKPYPGAYTVLNGKRLTIWSAHYVNEHDHHGVAGQVVEVSEKGFNVITGEGLLIVEEWESDEIASVRNHPVLGR